jgi:DNA-binding CsgD family transcriptional regulator
MIRLTITPGGDTSYNLRVIFCEDRLMEKKGLSELELTKTSGGFSFSAEFNNYREAFRQYWPLIVSIGLFFGWLLSFPFQGPLIVALAQSAELSPLPLIAIFLVGHIIGLGVAGILGFFFRKYLAWFDFGAILCIIISAIIAVTSSDGWLPLLFFMGLFAGLVTISWGTAFASSVIPGQRGRTFILGAVLANLILFVINLIVNSVDLNLLLITISFLPLGMPVFLTYWYRQRVPLVQVDIREEPEIPAKLPQWWSFLPFIFIIYAVGGLMYFVVGSLQSPPSGLLSIYGLIPYMVLLFVAGSLADIAGRRINAILGAIIVGIGFMSVGLFTGSLQYVAIQTLLVGGYAFLDTFTWVIVADVSTRRTAPLYYFAVTGTNVLAILLGVLLGGKIDELASGSDILTVSVAGLLSIISVALILKLKETRQHRSIISPKLNPDSLAVLTQKVDFTPRELDVVKLLIEGASTQEMLEKLVIAPDTLKSHLRNVYRKVGARNRLEFTLVIMRDFNYSGETQADSALREFRNL